MRPLQAGQYNVQNVSPVKLLQSVVKHQKISSVPLTPQVKQDDEFKKKTIEQLQLRSLCLVHTKEYKEFNDKFSARKEEFTLNAILRTFDPSYCENKTEPKKGKKSEDNIETALLSFLKEEQSSESQKGQPETDNYAKILNNDKTLSRSPSVHTNATELPQSASDVKFDWVPILPSNDHPNFDKSLRKEITKVVKLILSNMGKDNKVVEESRKFYIHNTFLLQTYDALVKKYYSSKKVKEDIIRYIIRKVLKISKKTISQTEKVKGKKASLLLCKRYFPEQFEFAPNKIKPDSNKEQEILEFLMPFSQNSKNKTINTNFVKEIFNSQAFSKDYQEFLPNVDKYLQEDNQKKLKKLLDVLMECAKSNNFKKVGPLKILPWLEAWINDTKKIALELWQIK